ncbi:MAG TPA: LLM class F420-dependent oxidoreductase, partial [Dehalococcoidia bacterium]
EAGRDPTGIGLDVGINAARGGPDDWAAQRDAWQKLGATHLTVGTMGATFTSPQQHIDAIIRCKQVLGGS